MIASGAKQSPGLCAPIGGSPRRFAPRDDGGLGALMTELYAVFSKVVEAWLKVGHDGGGGVGDLGRWFWGSSGLGFYPLRKVNPRFGA